MSLTAGAVITGGQLVSITAADTVSPCAVNGVIFGIAGHDAAMGAPVTVHMGAGVVHETPAAANVTAAGVALYCGAAGQITPTAGTGPVAGYSVRTATSPANVRWKSVG